MCKVAIHEASKYPGPSCLAKSLHCVTVTSVSSGDGGQTLRSMKRMQEFVELCYGMLVAATLSFAVFEVRITRTLFLGCDPSIVH